MPRTYFGPHNENYSTYANDSSIANRGRFPLGERLILPDGRVYRFGLNDGTAEVAGRLYQSVAAVGDHTNVAADVARAIGAVAISATLGATLAAIDIYAEGVVHINDAGASTTQEGYTQRIRRVAAAGSAHAAVAASGVITVNLVAGESVQVALTTAAEMSFSRNRFHQMLITATPPTSELAGVSPGVAAADRWYWSQVHGEAAVLGDGTLYAGREVQASIATAGAVESRKTRVRTSATAAADVTAFVLLVDSAGTNTTLAVGTVAAGTTVDITAGIAYNAPIVGMCIKANASTEESLIDLIYLGQ